MRRIKDFIATCAFVVFGTLLYAGKDGLQPGDMAPDFTARDQHGKDWRLQDHLGKKSLVIYFYPAAMTPGCTKQACAYRDYAVLLAQANTEVVAISGDTSESLDMFASAQKLNFTLLSDADGSIADKFGVPNKKGTQQIVAAINGVEKTLIRHATMLRWSFLLDKTGKILYTNHKVHAAQDSRDMLEHLLGKKQD